MNFSSGGADRQKDEPTDGYILRYTGPHPAEKPLALLGKKSCEETRGLFGQILLE